jgi:DinB superfamily
VKFDSMDTRTWTTQIDQITTDFKNEFRALTITQLNWRPESKAWSIAQNIDHLIVINESYYPVIQSVRSGHYRLPFIARFPFLVSFIGKTILNSIQPDRKRKIKTFPIWEPSMSEIDDDIIQRFEKHQNEFKQLIQSSRDLLARGVVISSPANRHIVYTLETAFDIIVAHEQRHLEQAREIAKALKELAFQRQQPLQ